MTDATPLTCLETEVRAEWVDYNGHMNDSAYAIVFSRATDMLMDWLGIDAAFRAEYRHTLFTLETHIRYLRQAHEGERLAVDAVLLDHDGKRLHALFTMRQEDDGASLATCESMLMNMDQVTGRPAPFLDPVFERVDAMRTLHGCSVRAAGVGGSIGIPRR